MHVYRCAYVHTDVLISIYCACLLEYTSVSRFIIAIVLLIVDIIFTYLFNMLTTYSVS